MMLTKSKLSFLGLATVSVLALSACASQAPRVSNAALGYAVTNYGISADSNEQALSAALGSALGGIGIATAMPAKADVTIDVVRYDSPIIGFFYGGRHYASLNVVLTDNSGAKIGSFPLYVAANGERSSADNDLAEAAAQIIAAKAANAFMPITARPKASPKPAAVPVAPAVDVVAPATDDSAPCVIGPDGKCLVL
jgi:hypothetical protein